MRTPEVLVALPIPVRYGVVGGICLGVPGLVLGLVVGLRVYVPTAWAATFELGIPAATLGCVLGLAVGSVVFLVRRAKNPPAR